MPRFPSFKIQDPQTGNTYRCMMLKSRLLVHRWMLILLYAYNNVQRSFGFPLLQHKTWRHTNLASSQDEYNEDLVELPVMFANEKDGESFDMERWRRHRSTSRYTRVLVGSKDVFFSVTTQRILPPVLLLVTWSAAVDVYNSVDIVFGLPELLLPLTPFELTAPILGLLLVFRTDRAFDR